MADWSLYKGIRGVDNWQQRRADEKYSLQVAEKRREREMYKTQEQMASQEYMNKYLDAINQMEVLGADKQRIKAAELEARGKIISGMKKFGGDASRFMKSGGTTLLHSYKNQILSDQRVQQAMTNKSNYAAIMKAKSEGKYLNKTPVRLAVMGEDGKQQIDPKTGQPMFQTKVVDPLEQIAMFENGYTNKLLYTGAEDMVKNVDYQYFLKRPKWQNDPYGRDVWVTQTDVYDAYRAEGASHEQAQDAMMRYGEDVQRGATPYQWGKKDELDRSLKLSQISKNNATTAYTKKKMAEMDQQGLSTYSYIASQYLSNMKAKEKGESMGNFATYLTPEATQMFTDYMNIGRTKNNSLILPYNMNVYTNDNKLGNAGTKGYSWQNDYGVSMDMLQASNGVFLNGNMEVRGDRVVLPVEMSWSPEEYSKYASGSDRASRASNGSYVMQGYIDVTDEFKNMGQNMHNVQVFDNANANEQARLRGKQATHNSVDFFNGALDLIGD